MADSPYSAKPGSLSAPVPGADLQKAADAFMTEKGKAPKIAANPQTDINAAADQFAAAKAPPPAAPAPDTADQPSAVGTALQTGAQALDYPGGLVRTGLAEATGLATGKLNTVKFDDVMNALKGKAPNSAEYLKRLGVSEGGRLNIPFFGSVPVRSIEGVALDIATDPLTAISKLAREVPYIGKLINAPGAASEAAGEAIYRSGLKKVDAKMVEKGGEPISDVLLASGAPTGTSAQLADHVQRLSDTMGTLRQGLYDKAAQLGAAVDLSQPMKRAEAVLTQMKRDPNLIAAAESLEDMMNKYKGVGKATIDQVSEWKTSLNDALPATAFDGFGKLKNKSMQFKQAIAADLRDAIVKTGNEAEKGLGDSINALNAKWSTIIDAGNPMAQQAKQAAGASVGGTVDTILLSTGHLPAAAAKKAMDLANTTYARTKFGKALINAGQSGIANTLMSRSVIEPGVSQAPQPPEQQ